jgi:hypothetical protein
MTCARCGMPANDRLCKECRRMEHQEDYYGTVDDEDGDDDE